MRVLLRLAVLIAFFSWVCSAGAQITSNGDITGTVKDPSGAALPGATVTITNADTGLVARRVTSDQSGNYSAPLLSVGRYNIDVESSGFKKVTLKNVELNAHDHLTEDVALSVGQATQTVTVEANAVQVELQTPAASGLITGRQIEELTLNTRNYEQLVALQPGVTYGGTSDQIYVGATSPFGTANTVNFSINGSRNSANNWTIDGADNVDRGANLTLLNYPSVDAISEFKTIRNQYNAEFGRNASGIINVVTKSGTNRFHGDAYEFFRNDLLNANTVPNKQVTPNVARPPLRYNNFGYTVGGPIPGVPFFKDKAGDINTFFFFSEEFRRVVNYTNFQASVPSTPERTGVFLKNVCVGHSVSNGTATCTQTLPAGMPLSSVVPVDPIAQQYLKDIVNKLAPPNSPPSDLVNGLLRQARGVFDNRQDLVRVDHTFGPHLSAFYRFISDTFPTTEPGGLFLGSPLFEVASTATNSPGRTHLGHVTASLSPTFLVDGGYAYSFGGIISKPTGSINTSGSPDVKAPNFFNLSLPRIPGVSFQTLSSFTGNGPYNDFNRNHNAFANLTKIIGSHTIKAGVTYNHYEKTENALGNSLNIAGTYAFAGGPAAQGAKAAAQCPAGNTDPACPSTLEQSFADFLTGFVPRYTQTGLSDLTPDMMQNQYEIYGQDEWRLASNLTLTLGARYSIFPPPIDANNTLTTFDPSLYVASHAPTLD
ncbi:MAG: adenylyl cyclase, partial [Acidobacteria bacterium]